MRATNKLKVVQQIAHIHTTTVMKRHRESVPVYIFTPNNYVSLYLFYNDASVSSASVGTTEIRARNALVLPFSQNQLPVAPNLNFCP